MSSIQPRKQRKAMYSAPLHKRRKQIASHLSEDLLLKYNRRSLPVIAGDEVKVLRGGSSKGKAGKVIKVDTKARKIHIEGITHKKVDGTDVALPVDPSNVVILRLNLEDKRRREKLGETAEPAKSEKAPAAKKTAPAKTAEAEAPAKPAAKADAEAPAKPAAKAEAEAPAEPAEPATEAKKEAAE